MKIIKDFPPNYKDIIKAIPQVADSKTVIFTYGDVVYSPYKKNKLSKDIRVHEEVHRKQQGIEPEKWWFLYLNDLNFRLSQEVEAYRKQYYYFVTHDHNLDHQKRFLNFLIDILVGPLYGNIVDRKLAKKLITNIK